MIRVRINNIELEGVEGQTILEVAGKAGIVIPTLCNKEGIEHYTSCMVCLVKDKKKETFIPSCSGLIHDDMDIDASGEEVIEMRKKALELLLSEHRAECEAQCRVVCPAGYNIPLLNRILASGNIEKAIELTHSEVDGSVIKCESCPGYCENACRRKKVDVPVSIRNIKLFVSQCNNCKSSGEEYSPASTPSFNRKRFSSRTGPLDTDELKEWLKECREETHRHSEINDLEEAHEEAENCMHCDCRAADNCGLRNLADEYSVKDPRGKLVNAPVTKKINMKTGLIFENAKCIKCGLCVRVLEDSKEEPGLCFLNRGFVSIISEPLTEEFDNILATKSDICIDICPTGALSRFMK